MQDSQQNDLLKLVADLSTRLEAQEQRLKEQEKELAQLRQVSAASQPVALTENSTSRRRLLKKVGLMAAGAAVAVTAGSTLNPTTSQAATGGNLLIGKVNYPSTSGDTTLVRTPVVFNGLSPSLVQANNIGIGVSGFKADEEPSSPGKNNNFPPKYGTPAGLKIAITGITLGADPNLPDIRNKVGVFGLSDTGKGVLGAATSGEGVFGSSAGGPGVYGESTSGVGGVFKGNRAPLRLIPGTTYGAPTTNTHDVGELYVDNAGKLYICIASGMPGTWKLLG